MNSQKTSNLKSTRTFHKDSLDYHDDVTPEAVKELQAAADSFIEKEQWELIDGISKEAYAEVA